MNGKITIFSIFFCLSIIGMEQEVRIEQEFALHTACKQGQTEKAIESLNNGASVAEIDKDGFSALHIAASMGDIKVVEALCFAGADVNLQSTVKKLSPLHTSIIATRIPLGKLNADIVSITKIIEVLLDRGAKVNLAHADSEGGTALHEIILHFTFLMHIGCKDEDINQYFNHFETILLPLLFKHGVLINTTNAAGQTPLHTLASAINQSGTGPAGLSCAHYFVRLAQLLLSKGANKTIKDHASKTAKDYVQYSINEMDGFRKMTGDNTKKCAADSVIGLL